MNSANDDGNETSLVYVAACMRHSGTFAWRIAGPDGEVVSGIAPNAATGYVDMAKAGMVYAVNGPTELVFETRTDGGPWVQSEMAVG